MSEVSVSTATVVFPVHAGTDRRASDRGLDDALAAHLPALRRALEEQREFRREQLADLDGPDRGAQPGEGRDAREARREVRALLATGARRALADIDLALARISAATYGRCRACDAVIPLVVLRAIPKATLCLDCQVGAG